MLDAACPGQVFTSPTPDQMLAAAQAVDGGAGIVFIVKNYEGDVMNFDMAAKCPDAGSGDDRHHQRRRSGRNSSTRPDGAASARSSWKSRRRRSVTPASRR
jgi:hypothetical protein